MSASKKRRRRRAPPGRRSPASFDPTRQSTSTTSVHQSTKVRRIAAGSIIGVLRIEWAVFCATRSTQHAEEDQREVSRDATTLERSGLPRQDDPSLETTL